ncbi:MAG: class IV adenylate cyclase [Planctomycetales bacterium]|nr:class IV adenylate cyclase [Planctomycetales bacterium]
MTFEVEQKFRVASAAPVCRQFALLGAVVAGSVEQMDTYYAHPGRDFAATDEALRIRRVGEQNCITYKGPKIDATTKTRREIEIGFAAGTIAAERCDQLLQALGFCRVATVSKSRQRSRLQRGKYSIELAADNVKDVGSFVELEIAVEQESQLDEARTALAALADELGLTSVERRSYLELLLNS